MKRLSFVVVAILSLAACDKSDDAPDRSSQLDENIDTIKKVDPEKGEELREAADEVAEKTGRDNLCELLNPELIRSVFELSQDAELANDDDESICSYSWEQGGRIYKVSLNFSSAEPVGTDAAQKKWDDLKAMPTTQENDLEPVKDVGDKAMWSKLGGGQLRVLAKGNLFYISVNQVDSAWINASMGLSGADGMTKEEAEAQKKKARDESKEGAVKLGEQIVEAL